MNESMADTTGMGGHGREGPPSPSRVGVSPTERMIRAGLRAALKAFRRELRWSLGYGMTCGVVPWATLAEDWRRFEDLVRAAIEAKAAKLGEAAAENRPDVRGVMLLAVQIGLARSRHPVLRVATWGVAARLAAASALREREAQMRVDLDGLVERACMTGSDLSPMSVSTCAALATVAQDETVGRRAVQAGIAVLNCAGYAGASGANDGGLVNSVQLEQVLLEARTAIRERLWAEYRARGLSPGVALDGLVTSVDVLLMTAVQAWLAGQSALAIHPYSASSHAWLSVTSAVALRQMRREQEFQETGG